MKVGNIDIQPRRNLDLLQLLYVHIVWDNHSTSLSVDQYVLKKKRTA